jgi:putative membrane protein insertion efficiency factor
MEQYETKQYSCSPIFQPSNSPALQSSASPVLHYSNTPSRHMGISITFLLIFFYLANFVHASPLKGPWDQNRPEKISQKQMDHRFNPLLSLVEAYRTHISSIGGSRCPMYPTCSKYSVLAFKEHGLFIGWMMTIDRLFRCGRDELRLSPQIIVNGELACYDPLENNDFWWYNGR